MKQCNMKGSIDYIETFGLVDGPGIRTVVFLNSCKLRCKFCHNPEMWILKEKNYSVNDVVKKVLRSKPYFKNNGGVTFSGGEPLLQQEFIINCAKELKKEKIHIAIDTAGITDTLNPDIFKYIDLVLLDIKHITKDGFKSITGQDYFDKYLDFIKELNKSKKEVWIRQVIVPSVNDNEKYIEDLSKFIKEKITNVTRIDFLPFHRLGKEKYISLNIPYPYEKISDMDETKCNELYKKFMEIYKDS